MISLIVAMTENRVIGRDGDMPWHVSRDLRRFKRLTMGHHIVMGRKTYESIGKPLPGRTTVVLSRSASIDAEDVHVVGSLQEALEVADADQEVFVTGGETVFDTALGLADRLYLTRLHVTLEGDTFFPEVDWSQWELVEETFHAADEKNDYDLTFQTYHRRRSDA